MPRRTIAQLQASHGIAGAYILWLLMLVGVTCYGIVLMLPGDHPRRQDAPQVPPVAPRAEADRLIAKHRCRTWDPETIPGHAVVGRADGVIEYQPAHDALASLEPDTATPQQRALTVYAFCP